MSLRSAGRGQAINAAGLQQRLAEFEARAALEQALCDEPPPVRLHPNLAQAYREKVEQLQEALAKPEDCDEAIEMLRRLIQRVVVRQAEEGLQIELVGEIVRLIELGLDGKRAALSAEEVCSVKVVAGAGFGLGALFVAPGLEALGTAM